MHKNESQRSAQEALAHNDARTWVLAGACRPLRRDDAVHADVVDLRAVPGAGAHPENALEGVDGGLDEVVQVGLGAAALSGIQDEVHLDLDAAAHREHAPGEGVATM